MPDVVVVGSLNQDIVVPVARHPRPGETVPGGDCRYLPGGKGANQAVAAARLGRDVAMLGCVGADAAGSGLLRTLAAEGVDVSGVHQQAGAPTGTALITVDAAGENAIVVSPGANSRLTPADLRLAADRLATAPVVLVQNEIPDETLAAAAALCRGTLVVNPAPARPMRREVLARADVLIPNRSELAILAGAPEPDSVASAARLAGKLGYAGVVIVTLGADGALVVDGRGKIEHITAPRVVAVDTTGAGDAFCGAVADALARGGTAVEAARWAVAAAAISVTRHGAQPGLATPDEVRDLLAR